MRYWRAPYFPHTRAPYSPSRDEQNRFCSLFCICPTKSQQYLSDRLSDKLVPTNNKFWLNKHKFCYLSDKSIFGIGFVRQIILANVVLSDKKCFVRPKFVVVRTNLSDKLSDKCCFLLFVRTNNKFCYLLFVICSLCQQIC